MWTAFKKWLFKDTAVAWLQIDKQNLRNALEDQRAIRRRETRRADTNYSNFVSALGQCNKLRLKLARSAQWNKQAQASIKKMKEQSALDHKYANVLQAEIDRLEKLLKAAGLPIHYPVQ